MVDVWQYYEYALDSEYAKVLNMIGLRSIIHVLQSFEYSSGFQYASRDFSKKFGLPPFIEWRLSLALI